MSDEIWRWSAQHVAQAIRETTVSCVEVTTAALERLAEVEPVSNAFGEVADDALDRAKEADAVLARGEEVGPLHGVPVAFKLNTGIEGRPTPDGVAEYLQVPAAETAPVIQHLLDAGCVEIGRTNVPSFSLRWCTESEHWGRTLNPWDPAVTAGGSSGGAAVAVATGVVPITHGNDIGGSIRYPAAVCGVVGLRPTRGRVPIWHPAAGAGMPLIFSEFAVEGALTRTVADARLALSVLGRPDPRDPNSVPAGTAAVPGARRVAIVTDAGDLPFASAGTPETVQAVRDAGRWLADAGYEVEEVELPLLGEAAQLWWEVMLSEMRAIGFDAEAERVAESQIARAIEHWFTYADDVVGDLTMSDVAARWNQRHFVRRQVSEFMADFPLLLLPNSGEPPFGYGRDVDSVESAVELIRHQWPNTAIPLLGLPGLGMGVTTTGGGKAPLGVQLIGRAFDEESVLQAAEIIERASAIRTPFDPVRPT